MKHMQFILTVCVLLLSVVLFTHSTVSAQACCQGIRGNIDNDPGDNIDIADLVYFVTYSFSGGPAPECFEEADVDASITLDIADIVYLVTYMFSGGPAPLDCPAPADDNIVYQDGYASGTTYEAFAGSLLEAVQESVDSMYAGTSGLEVTIPGTDPWWSGGAFTDSTARDLTSYNALTFWAKASIDATLDVAGLGNDNTGTSLYTAEMNNIALTTSWQKYVIPIPLASKLISEGGLFYFAEGEGVDYQIWMDEIVFENLGTITNPRPSIPTTTIDVSLGETVNVGNGTVIFDVDGTDVTVSAMPGYFTFYSSDPGVVSVGGDGVITAAGVGTAALTADLGATAATGTITVNVTSPVPEPATPAPTPSPNPADVVSLYSDYYTPATTVDTWSADWDQADVQDFVIGTDSTKKYTNLVFAGIEFTTSTLDASAMTNFHMDVWTPDPTAAPAVFKVKLVDFGADGAWGGGDDVEHELTFDENTMSSETWVSIDVPLASFTNLTTTAHIAQMIVSGDPNTVYVDNIFFYDSGISTEPTVAAPTPTHDPANVVSLYSDAYTPATTVDTWSAVWDDADVADFVVNSDNMKQYTNLNFAGIEFTTSTLDASAMEYFHMDVWTPDPTAAPAVFKVKLVDFGADGAWGGGDDVEHELTFDENTMSTGSWVGIDVPLTDFTNLTTTAHLAQMIISGDPNTVFVDNIYFYVLPPTEPTSSAPTPSQAPGDVVSVFSDTYTSTDFDTWSSPYDDADVADFVFVSDNMKQYTNLVFSIAEYNTSGTLDISAMTHVHIDLWTPDPTAAPAVFKMKLVDYGANGVWDGGGDDTEHELTFDENTMNTGSWVSLDIPLTDFAGMNNTGHFAQLILSGDPNTVFVDNFYFYDAGTPTAPSTAAPTPSYPASDVVSLFSDPYTDVTVDTWSAGWDMADVADTTIAGDNTKKYSNLSYAGIEFTSSTIDASGMTHFRMDIWTPDATALPAVFKIKLVDFGANGVWDGGGDDVEHELTFDASTTPALATGSWVTFDIPLTDFINLVTTGHMAQLVISGDPNTVFVDNVLFHK